MILKKKNSVYTMVFLIWIEIQIRIITIHIKITKMDKITKIIKQTINTLKSKKIAINNYSWDNFNSNKLNFLGHFKNPLALIINNNNININQKDKKIQILKMA